MTDNEIVKALECCANCESCDFETTDCPLGEEMECRSLLAKYALDLINRLQADVENYKKVAEHQQSVTMDRGFEIKKLKAEIERLRG